MQFSPTLCYFHKNNVRNITYMTVLIFLKNLDLRIHAYSRTASWISNFYIKLLETTAKVITQRVFLF